MRRFGAHMMTTGGLHTALHAGREAGCDVIQLFTSSPQQWKARAIDDQAPAARGRPEGARRRVGGVRGAAAAEGGDHEEEARPQDSAHWGGRHRVRAEVP